MRKLFEMDAKNYTDSDRVVFRPSVRGIIIKDRRLCAVKSMKYNYCKFPGGGAEGEETRLQTLVREVAEEAGLSVIPESAKEFGQVRRTEKRGDAVLVQDNFYYLCDVKDEKSKQDLDAYEADEGFTLCLITPEEFIETNRLPDHGPKSRLMIEREARVVEILLKEGYFD